MKPRTALEVVLALALLLAAGLWARSCNKAAEAKGRADRIETEYRASIASLRGLRDSAADRDAAYRRQLRVLSEEAAREVRAMDAATRSLDLRFARIRTRVPKVLVPALDSAAAACDRIHRACRKALAAKDSSMAVLTAQKEQAERLNAAAWDAIALADTTIMAKNEALHASGGFHIVAPLASGIVGLGLGLALGVLLRP